MYKIQMSSNHQLNKCTNDAVNRSRQVQSTFDEYHKPSMKIHERLVSVSLPEQLGSIAG